jgi:hypothetical protein
MDLSSIMANRRRGRERLAHDANHSIDSIPAVDIIESEEPLAVSTPPRQTGLRPLMLVSSLQNT